MDSIFFANDSLILVEEIARDRPRVDAFNNVDARPIIIAARASSLFDSRAVGMRVHYTIVNMPSALFDIPREQDYYGIFSATAIAGRECQNLRVDIRQYLPVNSGVRRPRAPA